MVSSNPQHLCLFSQALLLVGIRLLLSLLSSQIGSSILYFLVIDILFGPYLNLLHGPSALIMSSSKAQVVAY